MILQPIFCSFVAQETISEVDNTTLETWCKEQIYNSDKFKIKNITQSGHLDLNDLTLKPLIDVVQKRVDNISTTIGLSKQEIVRSWTNLNNSTALDQPHSHAKSALSCVYYVKGGESCGNLVVQTPITALNYVFDKEYITEHSAFTSSEMEIYPKPGMLIIFPSWLMHYVKQNLSSSERISIAFETVFSPL